MHLKPIRRVILSDPFDCAQGGQRERRISFSYHKLI